MHGSCVYRVGSIWNFRKARYSIIILVSQINKSSYIDIFIQKNDDKYFYLWKTATFKIVLHVFDQLLQRGDRL